MTVRSLTDTSVCFFYRADDDHSPENCTELTHTHTERKNLTMAGLNVFCPEGSAKLEGDAALVGFQRKQPSSLHAFCTASHLFFISNVSSVSIHVLAPGHRPQMLESFTINGRFQTDWDVEFHNAVAGPQSSDGETRPLIAHAGKESSKASRLPTLWNTGGCAS